MSTTPSTLEYPWYLNGNWWVFIFLFAFRYVRAVVNALAYFLYKPIPVPANPTYGPPDVSVIVCTKDIVNETFHAAIASALIHPIHTLFIATAGLKVAGQREPFLAKFTDPRIQLLWRPEAHRRDQTAQAVDLVHAPLLIISDDHTYWPNRTTFIPSLIAPFEDPNMGGVGPLLEARHRGHAFFSVAGFFNYLGMTYLLRRAHEFIATTSIDGGLSCLLSRFVVFRSVIHQDPEFKYAYLNDYYQGKRLDADDDKFTTRWLQNSKEGWKIRIQGGPDSTMTTELGEYPKFMGQCLRWTRTTYRSNPRALREPSA
ncbi:glycosyltransferase family 2 protein [Sporormia fimetaria CBS 119925]|uniref:Glycosyltransferase family 2 protein n=1 Tax=Sporormia fimetaria CBS 119925 TaxID=1340428 RepID=A0A6A6VGS5_9PLEO|nr:glycosyltransferase family 2 protein [Sporormia fimetaria CBS 119925]